MRDVQDRPITQISPYKGNPRKIPRRSVEGVKASIKRYGWQQPIVLDSQNVILAGHVRYQAAIELGINYVPCVYADDLSADECRAYRIDDNKLHELSGWNMDLLAAEAAGLTFVAFAPEELEALRAATANPEQFADPPSGGQSDEPEPGDQSDDWITVRYLPVTVNVRADRIDEAKPQLEALARTFDAD